MKSKRRVLSILLIAIMLLAASADLVLSAAVVNPSSVRFEGETAAVHFTFNPESTDLFSGFKGIMPGDTLTQEINVKNLDTDAVEIFLRAEPINYDDAETEETEAAWIDFLDQLTLKVTNDHGDADATNDTVIFDALASVTDGLTDNVSLGIFAANSDITLTAELSAPLSMGNPYQRRYGEIVWVFSVEKLDPPGDLIIEKTVTGDLGDDEKDWTFRLTLTDDDSTYDYDGDKTGTITSGDEFTLAHGESITIHDIPAGTPYQVSELEANTDGYITTVTGASGTIAPNTAAVVSRASFTNSKSTPPKGSLVISKTVTGNSGDLDREWEFTVTFSDGGSYPCTGRYIGTIASGGTITLKSGESVTISGIPYHTTYRVEETEANTDGYVTTSTGAIGEIQSAVTTAAFINDKSVGELELRKTVSGDLADESKSFTFTVTFSNGGTYNYDGSLTGSITSGGVIRLTHGQSVTIKNIPVGVRYTIVEAEANTDGYTTTSTGAIGTIANTISTAAFVNSKSTPPVGELIINKTVAGTAGEIEKQWHFTVEFSDLGTYTASGAFNGDVKSGDTITLLHGQSVIISGIPIGVRYEVTEAEANADGYVTTATGQIGTITSTVSTAAFVNTKDKPPTGDLVIRKTVSGNAADTNQQWNFTVTFSDGGTYPYTGSASGEIKSGGVISLKHSDSVRISGIPLGVRYEVVEAEANSGGYVTTATGEIGTITAVASVAAFLNEKSTGELVIRKTVAGNAADANRLWNFTVTFSDGGTYPYTGSSSGNIKSGGVIALKHDEYVRISGIPLGVSYTVVEAEANTDGYDTTSTGDTGVISTTPSLASFINSKSEYPTGELVIKKLVGGNAGSTKKLFTFIVTFSDGGSYPYSGSYTGVISSGEAISLKHGESVRVSGIPLGVRYEVVEVEANTDGYETTAVGEIGTITEVESVAVFTNTKNSDSPPTGDSIAIPALLGAALSLFGAVCLRRKRKI